MTFFIDLTDLILFVLIVGFIAFFFYNEGKRKGRMEVNSVVIKATSGITRRYDQFLFSHTLLKKVNASSIEIPEGFFDG